MESYITDRVRGVTGTWSTVLIDISTSCGSLVERTVLSTSATDSIGGNG